jgi:hypothetical protein
MFWSGILLAAFAAVVVVLRVRHLRRLDARHDAQFHTDLYRGQGGRAR